MGDYLNGLFNDDAFSDISRTFDWTTLDNGGVTFTGEGTYQDMSTELVFNIDYGTTESDYWMKIGMDFTYTYTSSYYYSSSYATGSTTTSASGSTSTSGSSSGSSSSVDSTISIDVCGIFEFFDVDGDGVYTEGIDIKEYAYSKPTFGAFEDLSPVDGSYNQFKTVSVDDVLGIQMYIAGSGATLDNGVVISANEMKFDVLINNVYYSRPDTMLGLCATLNSKMILDHQENAFGLIRGFTSSDDETTSYFTWTDFAESDIESGVNILASYDAETGTVYFSFNATGQPTTITWDPAIGVTGRSTSTSSAGSDSTEDGAAAVGFSILAILSAIVSLLL
jgi:hypothetical protein